MYVCERKGDKKVAEEADSACIDSLKFISRGAELDTLFYSEKGILRSWPWPFCLCFV